MHTFTQDEVKLVSLDGRLEWKVKCPKCGTWGYVDDDQLHGRVSMQCGNEPCDFHETHDLSDLIDKASQHGA